MGGVGVSAPGQHHSQAKPALDYKITLLIIKKIKQFYGKTLKYIPKACQIALVIKISCIACPAFAHPNKD